MSADPYITDAMRQLRKVKAMAEDAARQVDDAQFFATIDKETNSIAITMKHMAGNMRSRWTDFLDSDGEKPDRNRDGEFVIGEGENRADILQAWEEGWAATFAAIEPLASADLERIVRIRGEPHTVLEAVSRQLSHYAYHVGQIVQLAKHFAGPGWKTLSIPRGRSKDFDVSKDGKPYDVKP